MENQNQVFGHKPGLFLLFFTEMWERFSYYGMRALLVLFLVSEVAGGGWAWSSADALQLYGWYTGLVYLTPILGGIIADKLLGYRNAVVLGALLMTLGHASMALETSWSFYTGLGLLIFGNGFFKPNISTIVGQLYADESGKKDGAYTIFYMGINAGAFLGILLCGYVGEKIGWSWGFGLAGIFMGLGMIMFYFGQSILGELGKLETKAIKTLAQEAQSETSGETPTHVVGDRLIVIGILSFFTIFFWMAFEQAGGSMTIFANDHTERVLTGSSASWFFWVNAALTVVPLAIVTYVLIRLVKSTFGQIPFSNLSILLSFVIIWGIALSMLYKEYNMRAYEATFIAMVQPENESGEVDEKAAPVAKELTRTFQSDAPLEVGNQIYLVDLNGENGEGKLKLLDAIAAEKYKNKFDGKVSKIKSSETEVPASWFGILNSFFIIAFAPLFSSIWASKFNPSAPVKFGLGLILLGVGFGVLALGSMGISQGSAATVRVSMVWLVLAYLFHTLGELCVSPVGLAYVSKLAPAKLVGLMFGIWFGCTAIANFLAGMTGAFIEPISESYGLPVFFLIYTIIPIVAGLAMWVLTGFIKKKMHGIT